MALKLRIEKAAIGSKLIRKEGEYMNRKKDEVLIKKKKKEKRKMR